jgi:hypothetical protein
MHACTCSCKCICCDDRRFAYTVQHGFTGEGPWKLVAQDPGPGSTQMTKGMGAVSEGAGAGSTWTGTWGLDG